MQRQNRNDKARVPRQLARSRSPGLFHFQRRVLATQGIQDLQGYSWRHPIYMPDPCKIVTANFLKPILTRLESSAPFFQAHARYREGYVFPKGHAWSSPCKGRRRPDLQHLKRPCSRTACLQPFVREERRLQQKCLPASHCPVLEEASFLARSP